MSAETTTASVLMDVLDRTLDEDFREQIEDAGGNSRPDGCRPLFWEARFKLAHAGPRGDSPWMAELEHSAVHLLASGSADELRARLVHHAAITAAWVAAIDARSKP